VYSTLETALEYLERISKSEIENLENLCSATNNHICKQIDNLNSDVSSSSKKLISQVTTLAKDLDSAQEK
jgi:hypothetical protein